MKTETIVQKVKEFLNKFIELYKFPVKIFLDVFKVEINDTEKSCNAFVKIDPKFKFEYPIITPADFVIILQRLTPKPAFKIDEYSVNVYYMLGEVKEAQAEPVPVTFSSDILLEAIDRLAQPVLESKMLNAVIGYWVARGVASMLSDVLSPPMPEVVERVEYNGKAVVYK